MRVDYRSPEGSYWPDPIDAIEPPEKPMIPLEDALSAILFVICEIRGANNARMSVDCFAGAVGLLTYENRSMADIARNYGVTREAIRRRVNGYQDGMGIVGGVFQKRSQVGNKYSSCNHRNRKLD